MDSTRKTNQRGEPKQEARRSLHENADCLFAHHWEALYRFARFRVRDEGAVEDVVQETLLAAIRGQSRFRDDSTVRTWLIGILRHKIADYWRTLHRREAVESGQVSGDIESLFDEKGAWRQQPRHWLPDPSQLSENNEFWNVMDHCLDGLPPRARSVFTMRVIDDVSGDDVCKALKITATNLWVLLYRARLRLRACLEEHWFSDEGSRSR